MGTRVDGHHYAVDDDPFGDDFPPDECDHEDYDLDILTGRATCNMCDHRWYMSDAELEADEKRRMTPYDPEAVSHAEGG